MFNRHYFIYYIFVICELFQAINKNNFVHCDMEVNESPMDYVTQNENLESQNEEASNKGHRDHLIDEVILNELPHFENFFDRIGFKRIDGAVFGLLTLTHRALSSEEIQSILNLSQSAVSQSLKTLNHFGAIETRDSKDRKFKVHQAKTDSLKIVASVFRKREQEMVQEFKQMAQRVLELEKSHDQTLGSLRAIRMKSIIKTCEMAEATMNFVMHLATSKNSEEFQNIIEKFPKALNTLLEWKENRELSGEIKEKLLLNTNQLVSSLGNRLSKKIIGKNS